VLLGRSDLTRKRGIRRRLVRRRRPGGRRRLAQADKQKVDVATALVRAVDAKDSCTGMHSATVSSLCALIARQLGFESERVKRLRVAGLLHDIGKIGTPDAILNKAGKLTDAEFEVIKEHSVRGAEIARAAHLEEEAKWIRHHHERIDGLGYPDGLADDQIPLESRIILVADGFEAMISDRPYRKGCSQETAMEELERHAGRQFDPDCVTALRDVVRIEPGKILYLRPQPQEAAVGLTA
jgi:putative nucleotidyltransferase with HDIG domain